MREKLFNGLAKQKRKKNSHLNVYRRFSRGEITRWSSFSMIFLSGEWQLFSTRWNEFSGQKQDLYWTFGAGTEPLLPTLKKAVQTSCHPFTIHHPLEIFLGQKSISKLLERSFNIVIAFCRATFARQQIPKSNFQAKSALLFRIELCHTFL